MFMRRPETKNQLILIGIESIPNNYSFLGGFKLNVRLRRKVLENNRYQILLVRYSF